MCGNYTANFLFSLYSPHIVSFFLKNLPYVIAHNNLSKSPDLHAFIYSGQICICDLHGCKRQIVLPLMFYTGHPLWSDSTNQSMASLGLLVLAALILLLYK